MFETVGERIAFASLMSVVAVVYLIMNPMMPRAFNVRVGAPAGCGADPLTNGPDGFGGCFPGTANTGYPDGATLTTGCGITPDVDGVYNFTVSGTYNLCRFPGPLFIRTSGVTITNSSLEGPVAGLSDSLQGLVVEDSVLDCNCPSVGDNDTPAAITYNNFTLRRVEIFDAGHGAAPGSNVTIEDSYIHGLGGNTIAHKDGIFIGGGTNSTLDHNYVECNDGPLQGCTAAIFFSGDFEQASNWVVNNNKMNTNGAYCFYGNGGGTKPFSTDHITFTNNHFGRKISANCATLGPFVNWDPPPVSTWSGNVWDDDLTPVSP